MSKELEKMFLKLGYTKEDAAIIYQNVKKNLVSDEVISSKLFMIHNFFEEKGIYSYKTVKFIKYYSALLCLNNNILNNNWNNLIKLGFNDNDIILMVNHRPNILLLNSIDVINRLNELAKLGYSKNSIHYMVLNTPSILVQSIDGIKEKLCFIIESGYDKKDAIAMTSRLSSIFDYSYNSLSERFELLDYMNMHNAAIKKPMILKQSPKLTYARYKFFIDNDIEINEEKFKKLFMSEKQFNSVYHLNNNQLLKIYNYNDYLNNKEKVLTNY